MFCYLSYPGGYSKQKAWRKAVSKLRSLKHHAPEKNSVYLLLQYLWENLCFLESKLKETVSNS